MAPPAPEPRSQNLLLVIVAGALVLAIGLGAGYFLAQGGGDGQRGDPAASVTSLPVTDDGDPEFLPAAPLEATADEDAILSALEAFLTAEVAGDWTDSFELLTPTAKEGFGPASEWVQSHADLPPVTDFELVGAGIREGRVEADARLRQESSLDPFRGLVTARALGSFVMEETGGQWLVAYDQALVVSLYPSGDGISEAVLGWARDRQGCDDQTDRQHDPLIAVPALANELCDTEGDITVGAPSDLPESPDTQPLLAEYGPEAFRWARVVEVTGPVALRAVVAPLNDEWVVIAVLRPAL